MFRLIQRETSIRAAYRKLHSKHSSSVGFQIFRPRSLSVLMRATALQILRYIKIFFENLSWPWLKSIHLKAGSPASHNSKISFGHTTNYNSKMYFQSPNTQVKWITKQRKHQCLIVFTSIINRIMILIMSVFFTIKMNSGGGGMSTSKLLNDLQKI